MRVTFTKRAGRRYLVAIEREHGPPLQPRHGPGFDEQLPHDIAHYVAEEQLGLRLGVFGQLAAGGSGLFAPAPADRRAAHRAADRRIAAAGREDMRRSEAAAGWGVAQWRRRTGASGQPPGARPAELSDAAADRLLARLDEVARAWTALPPNGSLSFTWPAAATVDPAGTALGRRGERRGTGVSGPRRAPRRGRAPR